MNYHVKSLFINLDTAGQERYRSLAPYITEVPKFVLWSMTSLKESFKQLRN